MVRLLVRHAPTVLLLVLSIVAFGTLSYVSLPREAAPDVKIPFIAVTTPYVGVAPIDIESLLTVPIENEVAGIKDLKRLTSTSSEGASMIFLEFEPEVDIQDALQRVRDRVSRARPKLPDDAEEPAVREISFSDFPIMMVTIAGPADEDLLKRLAEDLKDDVERIPGVLEANLSGGMTREIHVQLDPRRLEMYGLGFNDVIGAIGNENVNIPGGDVAAGRANFLLRVPGEFTSPSQIEEVAVKRVGDRPVFVRDLGRVVDGYADRSSYARMNGQPALSLSIKKRAGANILDIGDEVKRLATQHARSWPEGVGYEVLADQSVKIRNMVTELENNILTALLLVVGVIFFFMGVRNSLFVALAIPLSMLISFAMIDALGMTLNMIVLFSLILALGMLVDNGIVIIENIYRHMEQGKDLRQASIDGTQEVAMAVAASTATTVAAFLPLMFWTGIMGQFMGYLPKTVVIVLVSSLIVALVVLPVVTSRFLKRSAGPVLDVVESRKPMLRLYRWGLEQSIRHRYWSASAGFVTLVVTVVLYAFLNHGTEFFPNTDPDRATIAITAPDGTDLETTDRMVRQIEADLARMDNVDVFVAESGVGGGGRFKGTSSSGNQARITVDFLPAQGDAQPGDRVRVESTVETIHHIREAVSQIAGAEIEVEKERRGPPVGAAISVEVSGKDFDQLGLMSARLRRQLAQIEGTTDISDDYRVGRPEMRLRIDRGAAKRVGASTAAIANAIRTSVAGTKASALRDGKDEYDILVQLDPRFRDNLQDVLALRIPGREDRKPKTFQVPLSTVASYELAGGSGAIRHLDQERVVTIEGDVAEGYNENAVRAQVAALLDQVRASGEIPPGTDVRLGGANDEQENARAFLGRAFLIAIAMISVVLVTQFNSFRLPFIIITTVVLSLVGVLWGLIITGTPFGIIMTGIGVISLAGVVVNNAIVLLDYVEKLRERGMDVHDALIRAGMTRFRPVMLTAVTTILGLVPMALGVSVDVRNLRILVGGGTSQFWGPMAIAVIFGLAFATMLTLVLIPTMYSIFEDLNRLGSRIRTRLGREPVSTVVMALLIALTGGSSAQAQAAIVTLDQAWAAAQEHNLDLAMGHERTVQTETLKGQALSLISPKLSVTGSYTINQHEIAFDSSKMFGDITVPDALQGFLSEEDLAQMFGGGGEPIVIQKKEYLAGSASVVQPLFNGSALPLYRGATRSIQAAHHDEESSRQHIRAAVTRSYYGLAVARERLRLAQSATDIATSSLELATRQVDVGAQPPRTRIQAQLSQAEAQRELYAARAGLTDAEELFYRTTGLSRDSELSLPDPPQAPATLDDALDDALAHRPDLLAAERRVEAARLSKVSKTLGWLPTVDGRFTYSYTENTGFSNDNTLWMAVFSANWTLWDGGLRLAQTRQEASRLRQAELAARQQRQVAEQDVRSTWQRIQQTQASLDAAAQQIVLAERNLALATRAYEAGGGTWLEVDQAQMAVFRAHMTHLGERARHDLAVVDLRVAEGSY